MHIKFKNQKLIELHIPVIDSHTKVILNQIPNPKTKVYYMQV